jgi:hypothetical protein
MEKLNERLIGKVLEHIKAFPETYNQNIVDARDLLHLTEDEANYLFRTAQGDPKKAYKTIQNRLKNIRKARAIVEPLFKQTDSFSVGLTTNDGTELFYKN